MLETNVSGLHLRLMQPADYAPIWKILQEPGILPGLTPFYEEVNEANYPIALGWGQDATAKPWTILLGEQIIGFYVLGCIDWRNRSVRVVSTAISKEYKDANFLTDVALAVRPWCRGMGLHRIWFTSTNDKDKILAKLGPTGVMHEGTDRQAILANGKYYDVHRFASFLGE
jgi:RimJ/RimL family protein N-acetyltransferase